MGDKHTAHAGAGVLKVGGVGSLKALKVNQLQLYII